MDLVPHVPHLHGLDIQFLRMHVDRELSTPPATFDLPQPNGHVFRPVYLEDSNSLSAAPNGLTNGYGHRRPSTYV